MLDHHLQRDIVYRLAFSEGLRFSELKPDDIENKLFTYHLKKVTAAGFVEKDDEGLYRLTPEGRRVGVGAFRTHHMAIDRAYSILLLVIRRQSDGAWLLTKRQTHPLFGRSGFMHVAPHAESDSPERARQEVRDNTGLEGEFTVCGGGYFRYYDGDELESFTHFTLLKCDDVKGELVQNNERAEYYWEQTPDFEAEGMLPNMPMLCEMYNSDQLQFVEKMYHI